MQYKAKHASLKGQDSETGGLNYGIFPYAPPQKRKRLTGNKLKVLQVINTIFPVGISAQNSHSAVSTRD